MSDVAPPHGELALPHHSGPVEDPMAWELPFSWTGLASRLFRALDTRDEAALRWLLRTDVSGEWVGRYPYQRGEAGVVEMLTKVLWDAVPAAFRHDWRFAALAGDEAVVAWVRSDLGGDSPGRRVEGVSFLRVRTSMLELMRVYELPAPD